jgi:hypothetical protein
MTRPTITRLAAMASLALLAGCGRSTDLETAPVRGMVTLDGEPYSRGGTVLFQPKGAGKMATGSIQGDGTYELTTYTSRDGAVVGKHKVHVQPIPPQIIDDLAPEPTFQSPIPEKYRTSSRSGLECDVKSDAVNEFNIQMKSR